MPITLDDAILAIGQAKQAACDPSDNPDLDPVDIPLASPGRNDGQLSIDDTIVLVQALALWFQMDEVQVWESITRAMHLGASYCSTLRGDCALVIHCHNDKFEFAIGSRERFVPA